MTKEVYQKVKEWATDEGEWDIPRSLREWNENFAGAKKGEYLEKNFSSMNIDIKEIYLLCSEEWKEQEGEEEKFPSEIEWRLGKIPSKKKQFLVKVEIEAKKESDFIRLEMGWERKVREEKYEWSIGSVKVISIKGK